MLLGKLLFRQALKAAGKTRRSPEAGCEIGSLATCHCKKSGGKEAETSIAVFFLPIGDLRPNGRRADDRGSGRQAKQ